jgi:hypothetical protein
VAGRYDDAGARQSFDRSRADDFRGKRDHRDAAARRRYNIQQRLVSGDDIADIMDAAFFRCQEGAFQMNAEHAGHFGRNRIVHGLERPHDLVGIVADERGQKAGGPITPMGLADGADRIGARLVVEQCAPAAVHLRVYEAGSENAAVQFMDDNAFRNLRQAHDGFDDSVAHDYRPIAAELSVEKDPGTLKCVSHHNVLVTLLRWGGRSGSWPRATLNSAASR